MIEDMQRLGILASGETAGELADLSEAEARAVSDILSSGAERARADRETGLTTGVDLSGIIADRDLATAELIGRTISGDKTIGGRQAALDVIAAITAVFDPKLELDEGVDRAALANSILETSGWDDETKAAWRSAFGITPAGQGGGTTLPPSNQRLLILEGEVIAGGDENTTRALNEFLREMESDGVGLGSGTYYIKDGILYKPDPSTNIGQKIATWNPETNKWERR